MPVKRTYKRTALTQIFIVMGILIVLNVLSSVFFVRYDLTEDKRFTLDDSTKKMLTGLKDELFVKVYLKGNLLAGFKRLSTATREMLDEFKVYAGDKLQYEFVDETTGKTEKELNDAIKELSKKGLAPTNVQNKEGDAYSQQIVIPGALMYYNGKEAAINLLENTPGTGAQNALNTSDAHLEYNLSKAIHEVTASSKPKIAFIRGHGEMENGQLNDLLTSLSDYYNPEFLDLPGVVSISRFYKCIIIAKPTRGFSDKDKFKIDQYIMNGGSVLWLVEALNAELDSVVIKRSFITMDYPLNLDDQLFRYGVRVNPDLLLDLRSNPVPLMTSLEGQRPDFKLFDCFYFPVLTPVGTHPITRNIDAVESQFSSVLDTLVLHGVKKTVLLQSSDHSRIVFTPWLIDFRDLRMRPNPADYNKKNLIAAVLLEGKFTSAFKNRVPDEMASVLRDSLKQPYKDLSEPAKMIVVADGDIAANQFSSRGEPLPLGLYQYTGEYFGNKNFLLNSIDYLCGSAQLINTRSKTIKLRLLDDTKVKAAQLHYQLINMLVPLGGLLVFGLIFNFIRIRKYTV